MKKRVRYIAVFGFALWMIGLIIDLFGKDIEKAVPMILTFTGAILLITCTVKNIKFGGSPDRDEITIKQGAFALAWLVTMTFIYSLLWLDHYDVVKLTVAEALGLSLSVTLLAAGIFQSHFKKKGDAE